MIYHLNLGYPFLDENLEFTGLPELLAAKMLVEQPLPNDKYGERVDSVDSRDIPGPIPSCSQTRRSMYLWAYRSAERT